MVWRVVNALWAPAGAGETIECARPVCKRARALDWNDLRYFLAVSRAGTFVRAGKELGVEHTTVARRLAALEAALGVKLFARGPEGMTLTAAGHEVLPSAEAMAALAEEISRRVAGGDGRVEGTVRLTIPESMNGYTVEALTDLRARHPALVVEVLSDNRALDLRRGEADVAVRIRDSEDGELIARKIGTSGWSMYASPAYVERKGTPRSPEELAGHEIVGFAPSMAAIVGARWLEAHGAGGNVVLRANSINAALDAAAVGFGIVFLPCFVADRSKALVRLTPRIIGSRDILLVVHPDLARVARIRATMEFLVERFARDAALWSGEPSAQQR